MKLIIIPISRSLMIRKSHVHPQAMPSLPAWWSPRCQHKMLRSAPKEALPSGFPKHLKGRRETEAKALRCKGHKGEGESTPGGFLGTVWIFDDLWWFVMIFGAYVCICNYLTHGRFSAGPSGREACHVLRIKMATRCQSMCPRSFGLGSGWLRIP